MKVVIDTNVFVSSFFGGTPRKVINLWGEGRITLCLSTPIVEEYTEVLGRLGLTGEDGLTDLLALFANGYHCLFAARTPDLRVVVDDPDDDRFIECAVALNAAAIVSGDRDLLAVESYMGIRVLTPRQLLGEVVGTHSI